MRCCESCRVCHHLLIKLPSLLVRTRTGEEGGRNDCLLILNRGADPHAVTNLLASRCLSSTDIFVHLCAFMSFREKGRDSCGQKLGSGGCT